MVAFTGFRTAPKPGACALPNPCNRPVGGRFSVWMIGTALAIALAFATGPALPQNWVDIDNRAAVVAAVQHVLAQGFGRIAFAGESAEARVGSPG